MKKAREKLIVLPLESLFGKRGRSILFFDLKEDQSMVLNRDGIYFNRTRNLSWFEVEGKAYEYSSSIIKNYLNYLNAVTIPPKVVKALKILTQENLATKKQKDLFHLCELVRYNQQNKRAIYLVSKTRKRAA